MPVAPFHAVDVDALGIGDLGLGFPLALHIGEEIAGILRRHVEDHRPVLGLADHGFGLVHQPESRRRREGEAKAGMDELASLDHTLAADRRPT